MCLLFFFFKQKTAYEMRISDWSSDVCSSDLRFRFGVRFVTAKAHLADDPADAALHIAAGMRDAPVPRARQYRCQMRGFGRRQLCRRMMEVGLRRRLDTVDAGTEFGDVEIDLENALLRPQCFDQDRKSTRLNSSH